MERVRVRIVALLGVLALSTGTVAGGALWLAAQPAAALTTITVTSNADPGVAPACPGSNCTLRQAFTTASGTAGDVEIDIAGTINLTAGELLYNGSANLTVAGNGTITQGNSARIIHFTSAQTLTVSGLTLIGGQNCRGGGIDAPSGSVVLTNTTVTQATSTCGGGGIWASGSVTATGSTVSSNHANSGSGGGIETGSGSVTLTNSTVTGNTAADGGGGIVAGENQEGFSPVTLTASTVDHNTAGTGDGGGVEGSSVHATNSTITNNTVSSSDPGGGIAFRAASVFVYDTIASNSSTDGANVWNGSDTTLTSVGTVIALPLGGGTDCTLHVVSQGYNWDDDGSCGFTTGPGDHSNAGDPLLGALANNGGPTQTRLPQDGPSPLIDAIPPAACQTGNAAGVTTDQRGVTRPQGAGCDIGAVEVAVPVAPTTLTAAFTG